MYKKFFGLKENPFNVNPDPRYLFLTHNTQEALACLTYGIETRKGFILLTGEVGTGKTTLINKLLEWLHKERVSTAFVFNPRLSVSQFFDFMMADFGIVCESRQKGQMLLKLNQWLLERYQAGERAVLIVDEAQNLSPQMLEEIRLLTNLETSTEKLLQIVLSGQPELEIPIFLSRKPLPPCTASRTEFPESPTCYANTPWSAPTWTSAIQFPRRLWKKWPAISILTPLTRRRGRPLSPICSHLCSHLCSQLSNQLMAIIHR